MFRKFRGITNKEKLIDLYQTGKHSTSFGGQNVLTKFYKNLSADDVKDALSKIDSYTRHKVVKPPKIFNPTFVRIKRKNLQIDLAEVKNLAEWNNGVKFIFVCIDAFSRRVWLEPLKSKKGAACLKAFKLIVARMGRLHEGVSACSDFGGEFYNKGMKKYLKEIGMKLFSPSTNKCAVIERSILSLKRLITQYITAHETKKYYHMIPSFENVINNRVHRMIKMTPMQADLTKNRDAVNDISQRRYNKAFHPKQRQKKKFKVGDIVRFAKSRQLFDRGYDETHRIEVARVTKILTGLPVIMYQLEEWNGTPITGRWYSTELTKFTGSSFKIKKIIKTRKRGGIEEYLVSWLGYSRDYDSWITKDKLDKKSYDTFRNKP